MKASRFMSEARLQITLLLVGAVALSMVSVIPSVNLVVPPPFEQERRREQKENENLELDLDLDLDLEREETVTVTSASTSTSTSVTPHLRTESKSKSPPQPKPQPKPKQPQSKQQPKQQQQQRQQQQQQQPVTTTTLTQGLTPDGIDWSDDIFVRSGWDGDPIVIESHKLLFFTVPKNACTTFKKLFRRMMGYDDWLKASAHNPKTNGLRYLGNYNRKQQTEMMVSPEWTRAIFVRDPMERALSAYSDKAMKTTHDYWKPPVNGAYLKRICCKMNPDAAKTTKTKPKPKPKPTKAAAAAAIPKVCRSAPLVPYEANLTKYNFPFAAFVDGFLTEGSCNDPHWRPQIERMSIANWKYINFVGRFENQMEDTHRLLKQIGAYDEFGASGWGKETPTPQPNNNGNNSNNNNNDNLWTLPIFATNIALHKTGSGSEGHMNQHYHTNEIREAVRKHYGDDYRFELFGFTDPFLELETETETKNKSGR